MKKKKMIKDKGMALQGLVGPLAIKFPEFGVPYHQPSTGHTNVQNERGFYLKLKPFAEDYK